MQVTKSLFADFVKSLCDILNFHTDDARYVRVRLLFIIFFIWYDSQYFYFFYLLFSISHEFLYKWMIFIQ